MRVWYISFLELLGAALLHAAPANYLVCVPWSSETSTLVFVQLLDTCQVTKMLRQHPPAPTALPHAGAPNTMNEHERTLMKLYTLAGAQYSTVCKT